MFNAKTNYAKIAFETILFYVSTGQIRKNDENKISADLKLKRACVVSVYDSNQNLRGCMGDPFPQKNNLYDEIIENSIAAASKDSRYQPLQKDELNQIKVAVDVLSIPQKIENFNAVKPQKHGLYVTDKEGNSGFIMPGTKGIKTTNQLTDAVKKTAGLEDKDNKDLAFMIFKTARYE
ncbi:MAG TPA: AMMECR1 domain-containing protein [Bacteroidales bacterium]|nr:AMMECR1 domain-containing protein [Bacteroidales bacterium]